MSAEVDHNRPMTPVAIALALLLFCLWGANNLAIKVAVETIPPLAAAGLRFSLGLVFLAATARAKRVSLRPQPGEFRGLWVLSSLFLIQVATMNWGQKLTSAVRGTVFLAAHPLFVALFAAWFIAGDQLNRQRSTGLFLAFAGVFATFAEGFLSPGGGLLGDAIMILSAVLLGGRLVYLKLLIQKIPAQRTLVWQVGLAVPIFYLLSALLERHLWGDVGLRHVGAMLYQGVVIAGFCFTGNAWLYERFRASQVAAYTFTTPLWGVLWCGLIGHEPITAWVLAGVGLVALGIAVASRGSQPEEAELAALSEEV